MQTTLVQEAPNGEAVSTEQRPPSVAAAMAVAGRLFESLSIMVLGLMALTARRTARDDDEDGEQPH